MDWYIYPLVVGIGIIAGIVNTLAAGGSMLTLPVLMALGLPPNMANGTNRIAIFLQNVVGASAFYKQQVLDLPGGLRAGLPAVAGSLLGAFIAVNLNDEAMKLAIAGVMLVVFFLILLKPGPWIDSRENHPPVPSPVQMLLFFAVGIYGGFIQAGVGFFLLTSLVLASGFEVVKANALKVFIIMLYSPVALVVFFVHGDVDIWMGLLLAAGNMTGAYLATRIALKKGAVFIRWFVLAALLIASLKMVVDVIRAL